MANSNLPILMFFNADVMAVTIQFNKIVSSEVKDN